MTDFKIGCIDVQCLGPDFLKYKTQKCNSIRTSVENAYNTRRVIVIIIIMNRPRPSLDFYIVTRAVRLVTTAINPTKSIYYIGPFLSVHVVASEPVVVGSRRHASAVRRAYYVIHENRTRRSKIRRRKNPRETKEHSLSLS